MRAPAGPTNRRLGAFTAACGVAIMVGAAFAGPAAATPAATFAADPTAASVTRAAATNGCNGVQATPGSQSTSKTLVGGSTQPGAVAAFAVEFPVEESHVGETFTLTDCVYLDGEAAEKYTITFTPTDAEYVLHYSLTVPAVPLGTEYCNYAKTTGGPNSPRAGNRKANPACFAVGGALRVENQDTNGAVLPGATYSVVCSAPVVVDGISDGGLTASGIVGISGPAGTTCVVTETAAPTGYLPAAARTLTIPALSAPFTAVFVNTAAESPSETVSPSETPSESVSPSETPAESVSPSETPAESVSPSETPVESVSPSETPAESVSPSETPFETVSETPSEDPEESAGEEEPTEEPTYTGPVVEPGDPDPTISPTVLGTKATRAPASGAAGPAADPAALPDTGTPAALLLFTGLALVALGGGMALGTGRERRRH